MQILCKSDCVINLPNRIFKNFILKKKQSIPSPSPSPLESVNFSSNNYKNNEKLSLPDAYNKIDENHDIISHILITIESLMNEKVSKRHLERQKVRKPFVTLSYAQTLNGMIAKIESIKSSSLSSNFSSFTNTSSNLPISCPESFQLTHALRSIHDGILVGKNTMIVDNPRLNVRLWKGKTRCDRNETYVKQPRPLVLDSNLNLLLKSRDSRQQEKKINLKEKNAHEKQFYFLQFIRANNVIICCNQDSFLQFQSIFHDELKMQFPLLTLRDDGDDVMHLSEVDKNVTLVSCKQIIDDISLYHRLDLDHVLLQLKEKCGIKSVMVEGGSSILSSFISASAFSDIVDCACVTIAPSIIGSDVGLNAFNQIQTNMIILKNIEYWRLGTDCIMLGQWPKGLNAQDPTRSST